MPSHRKNNATSSATKSKLRALTSSKLTRLLADLLPVPVTGGEPQPNLLISPFLRKTNRHRKINATSSARKSKLRALTSSKITRSPAGLLPVPVTGGEPQPNLPTGYTVYVYDPPIPQADERSSVDRIGFPGYDGVAPLQLVGTKTPNGIVFKPKKRRRRSLTAAYPDYAVPVAGGDPKPNPPFRYAIYAPKPQSDDQIDFPGYDGVAPLQLVGTTTQNDVVCTCDSKIGRRHTLAAAYEANRAPVAQPHRERSRSRSLSTGLAKFNSIFIPDDIMFEVLARLPAKALIRFTVVSRGWRTLIRGCDFIIEHRRLSGLVLLIHPDEKEEHSVFIHRPENVYTGEQSSGANVPFRGAGNDPIKIVGAAQEDGLVGMVQFVSEIFWIWNPSTHSSVSIPFIGDNEWSTSAGLASDGQVYSIIRIVCSPVPTASVFNLNTANWIEIIGTLSSVPLDSTCTAIVAGVPFWLLEDFTLAWFNISSLTFIVEELGWPEVGNNFCFGEIEAGVLGAVVCPFLLPVVSVSVFSRETGGRWVQRYSLGFQTELLSDFLIGFYCLKDEEYVVGSIHDDDGSLEVSRLFNVVGNEHDLEVIAEFEDCVWDSGSKLVNVKESLVEPPRVGVQGN